MRSSTSRFNNGSVDQHCARGRFEVGPPVLAAAFAIVCLAALSATASELTDNAFAAWSAKRYDLAARWYFEVLQEKSAPIEIAEAEFGLAESLRRMKMPTAAALIHQRVARQGPTHAYFDGSLKMLVDLGFTLRDPAIIPNILNKAYLSNARAMQDLKPELRQSLHLHLGRLALRNDDATLARRYLLSIERDHPRHASAQHLLARLELRQPVAEEPNLDLLHGYIDDAQDAISHGALTTRAERIQLGLLAAFVRGQRSALLPRLSDKAQELGPVLGFRRDLKERNRERAAHLLAQAVAQILVQQHTAAAEGLEEINTARRDPEVGLLRTLALIESCRLPQARRARALARKHLDRRLQEAKTLLGELRTSDQLSPQNAAKTFKRLRALPGRHASTGLDRLWREVERDLSRITAGDLGKGGLPAALLPKLEKLQRALQLARGQEIRDEVEALQTRWQSVSQQLVAADKLLESLRGRRPRNDGSCWKPAPRAGAALYGAALLRTRSR